jgi:hypothetical protein
MINHTVRPLIQPVRCAVRAGSSTARTARPSRPQATAQPASARPHSFHSWRARACPYRGGRWGGGPPAKAVGEALVGPAQGGGAERHGGADADGGEPVGGAGRAARAEVEDGRDEQQEVEDRGAGQQHRAGAWQARDVAGDQAGAEQAPEADLARHDEDDEDAVHRTGPAELVTGTVAGAASSVRPRRARGASPRCADHRRAGRRRRSP